MCWFTGIGLVYWYSEQFTGIHGGKLEVIGIYSGEMIAIPWGLNASRMRNHWERIEK